MNSLALRVIVGAFAIGQIAAGCRLHTPPESVHNKPSDVAPSPQFAPGPPLPVPADLPIFGTPSKTSIRVAVFGRYYNTLARSGYYHLPRGATVREALEAAGGLGPMAAWRDYSGVERRKPDGSFEVIPFTRDRTSDEQMPLRDGDIIFISHEVF